MNTLKMSAQSAAERRTAEAVLRSLVTRFTPEQQRLVHAMRRSLRKRLPTAHEIVYEYSGSFVISFSPNERGYEGVLVINGSANGVRLYLGRVKGLPDPEKLLQGVGSKARWIPIEAAATLTRPAVAGLIDETIARNRIPFARTGRGSIVIRSTAAKRRRKPRSA